MKRLSSLVLCGVASCAFASPHAKFQDGKVFITGIDLPMTNTQHAFIYEDPDKRLTPLSTIKHTSSPEKNTDMTPQGETKTPAPKKPSLSPLEKNIKPQPAFIIRQGERYITALGHWFTQAEISQVAYALPPDVSAALNAASENGQVFKGSLKDAIHQLSQTIKKTLYFSRNAQGLAAIHTIQGSVDIHWIHGTTLKEAIKHLTQDYRWQWTSGDNSSWMAPDNYTLIAPYPVVAPRGDFAFALNTVLDGYPVQAQLLYATKNIFIVEKE